MIIAKPFFVVQLVGFLIAVAFAAGGGNHPGVNAGSFIYIKAFLLAVPFFGSLLLFLYKPQITLRMIYQTMQNNIYLLIYCLFIALSIPLAVDWSYSLNRALYTFFALGGVFALIMQYYILFPNRDAWIGFVEIIALIALLLPLYVAVTQPVWPLIPDFRNAIQSLLLIHSNLLASFYAQLVIWFGLQSFFTKGTKRLKNAFLALIFLLLVLILFSRGVFVALFIAAMILTILGYVWYRKPLALAGASLLIAVMLGLGILMLTGILDTESVKIAMMREGDPDALLTLTNRTTLWQVLLSGLTVKTFMIGHGYSVMTDSFGVDFGTGILYGAHNAYLSVLLGCGILALLVICAYFLNFLWTLRRLRFAFPSPVILSLVGATTMLMISSLISEEFGVSVTITFAWLVLLMNILFMEHNA